MLRSLTLYISIALFLSSLQEGHSEPALQYSENDILKHLTMTLKARDGVASNAEVVLEHGFINPKWTSKCSVWSCSPHTFGVYTDEVVFQFSYASAALLRFSKPVVRAMRGRAKPVLKEFSFDNDVKAGEISIWHKCITPTKANREDFSLVSLEFQISPSHTVQLTWRKTCGGGSGRRGFHPYIDVGYLIEHVPSSNSFSSESIASSIGNTISNAISGPTSVYKPLSNQSKVVFGPRVLSTKLYLRLKEGAHSQQFDPPHLYVDFVHNESPLKSSAKQSKMSANLNESARNDSHADQQKSGVVTGYDKNKKINLVPSIELRGPVNGGMLRAEVDTIMDVIYTCVGTGIWIIRFNMMIKPFEPIQISWRKDCGGGIEKSVQVADDPVLSRHQVVSDGTTLKQYTRDGAKSNHAQRRKWYGNGNRPFYLFVDGRNIEGGVAISDVAAHSEDENTAIAHMNNAQEAWPMGYKSVPDGGEVVTTNLQRLILVKITCFKRGDVRTVVRISIRDRKPIEFVFWNRCYMSKRQRHKQYMTLWSIGVMVTAIFVIVTILLKIVTPYPPKPAVLHSRYRGLGNRFRVVYPYREDRSL